MKFLGLELTPVAGRQKRNPPGRQARRLNDTLTYSKAGRRKALAEWDV
jgi:hypothetical protein